MTNWTKEQILEYNKMCILIIGGICIGNLGSNIHTYYRHDFFFDIEREGKYRDNSDAEDISLLDMKFHSDWNWIMVVVNEIENNKYHFQINTLWNEFNQCSYTQVSIIKEVGEISKDRKVISNSVIVYEKHSDTYKDKKEAVVQAINQFLIWYNQNKDKRNGG